MAAAIRTENLSKRYGGVNALDSLNLEVPQNTVFGFLGPNGAGKTTTVKLLTGFSRPTSGSARVAGEEVGSGNLALLAKIGFLPDVPVFYDWMTGREFLNWVGELHSLPQGEIRQRTDELLELSDLKNAAKRRIGGYSRGMRQRLGIAQALVNHPQVLFLDEPTSALDPIGRREILKLVSRLGQTTTVFMSTHILSDAEQVCNMVGIINKGKLVTVSPMADLQRKYARSVFEMEFLEDAGQFVESLKQVPWLTGPEYVTENGTPVVRVTGVDIATARKGLPGLIGACGLTLSRYELASPSLEDIFINIVSSGDAP